MGFFLPQARDRGLGRKLIQICEQQVINLGREGLTLLMDEDNLLDNELYRKCRFSATSLRTYGSNYAKKITEEYGRGLLRSMHSNLQNCLLA